MAKNRGWWDLEVSNNSPDEVSDTDREHIAALIKEGFTCGDLVEDE